MKKTQNEKYYRALVSPHDRNNSIPDTLEECLRKGYKAMFVPELVDRRIAVEKPLIPSEFKYGFANKRVKFVNDEHKKEVNNYYTLLCSGYVTPSSIITGYDKKGKAIIVFAHCENWFSNPENIRTALNDKDYGEKTNWGAKVPKREFHKLIEMGLDDENIFVISYNQLIESSGHLHDYYPNTMPIEEALKHPMVIPFLGGEERASQYIKMHKEVYGKKIIVDYFKDDLRDEPIGRNLWLGFHTKYSGLFANRYLENKGLCLGIRK